MRLNSLLYVICHTLESFIFSILENTTLLRHFTTVWYSTVVVCDDSMLLNKQVNSEIIMAWGMSLI